MRVGSTQEGQAVRAAHGSASGDRVQWGREVGAHWGGSNGGGVGFVIMGYLEQNMFNMLNQTGIILG